MAAISKNVCFNVLDDIVNKYNNTVHRTIKIKLVDVTNLELVIVLGYQNTKTVLLKDRLKIGQKKFVLAKLKIQFHGHTQLVI